MQSLQETVQITEGATKILVPKDSMDNKAPPKKPVFFNPRAKLNRDFSIIAYSAFYNNFERPKVFLDGMAGLGARALRVANEIKHVEKIVANDVNAQALELCTKSKILNDVQNLETSENEICRFLSSYSQRSKRASIVDIDPFGSPSKYVDCAIRATMHGGMLSTTATDLQVLHGLFPKACKRRYYGIPIKTEYSNEIAIRLILGCQAVIASRLDIHLEPLFVENDLHYYRTYVKVFNKPSDTENIGYILHCKTCGNRKVSLEQNLLCNICNSENKVAGPLWIGKLFDGKFIESMLEQLSSLSVDKKCEKLLQKSLQESQMPATYYTLDELASAMKKAPLSMDKTIKRIQDNGYEASPTSLNSTGFRTNCTVDNLKQILA